MSNVRKILVTGITGYIGGTVAVLCRQRGHDVLGLARKEADIAALARQGFKAVKGSLQDADVLEQAVAGCDAVIHTADSDDPDVAERFIALLAGTGKTFIYTSGSAIVANLDRPETADFVYTEDYPLGIEGAMGGRVAINNAILRAAIRRIRSIVIVPSMVYGEGLLLARESKQVPQLVKTARERGQAVHVGDGTHCWSNVHVEDLAELYLAALEKARPGSCFFAENGMDSFRDIALAIQKRLGLPGTPAALSLQEAVDCWGPMMATYALGSNCRLNADKARLVLGWRPRHVSVLPSIQAAQT